MAYFLFKRWPERLFYLNRENVINQRSDLTVSTGEITINKIGLVADLRGEQYIEQFSHQLAMGDYGIYAYCDKTPVGYGWVKHKGSEDYFYNIPENVCYLCRFFVHESYRGHNIYPELICKLIEHESSCNDFYIDVETGNLASEKGLKKVGFQFVKEYRFLRGFKHTFNKVKLSKVGVD